MAKKTTTPKPERKIVPVDNLAKIHKLISICSTCRGKPKTSEFKLPEYIGTICETCNRVTDYKPTL